MNKGSKKPSNSKTEVPVEAKLKSKRGREKKVKSDIKKAKTSYNYFAGDKAMREKASKGGLGPKEVMGKLGEIWKTLSEKDKKPFVELAEKDKKRFNEESQNKDKNGKNVLKKASKNEDDSKAKKKKVAKKSKSTKEDDEDDEEEEKDAEEEEIEEDSD